MPYIDPILKNNYQQACRRAIGLFLELRRLGFPDDRMGELSEARQAEDEALAKIECGHNGKDGTKRYPVSKEGEKGRTIRESVMREFGIEPPPRFRKGLPTIKVDTSDRGLFELA